MYEGTNLTPHSDVDQESPQNTCFFIFIAIPGLVTTMLLFSFFATFLENLLSLKIYTTIGFLEESSPA